jgi:hypothetical protein
MEYFRWMFSDFCHLDRFPADLNDFPGGGGGDVFSASEGGNTAKYKRA